jgi:hypothetical protein
MEERYDIMHCQSVAINETCSCCSCHVDPREAVVYVQAFCTSAIDGCERLASYIERFIPGKRTHLMGGRLDECLDP